LSQKFEFSLCPLEVEQEDLTIKSKVCVTVFWYVWLDLREGISILTRIRTLS